MELKEKIKSRLDFIYKSNYDKQIIDFIAGRVEETKQKIQVPDIKWTEEDIVLITYGDSIVEENVPTLQTLKDFLLAHLKAELSYVHILPFFPYSSDDGFSVIDYKQVNPALGDWGHVNELSASFKLMFDLVINHISQHSEWFKNYLNGVEPGKGFFIEAEPETDLSAVVRPRSLPLLTPVEMDHGPKHVWTTFSADQIDLNFANPKVLASMVDVYLYYLEQGASMIRLDAIAFLWKEIGTNCLHLPETHEFVKLLRDIADYLSPGLVLLTETNVPNKENMSYFGDNDEANMVYQFSLPPLLLHALFSGNSTYLTQWASGIPGLPSENTFFNFTASHDGIGVRPLEGLLPQNEFDALVQGMKDFGGRISTKRNSDGSDSPYEMNITYFDAMKGSNQGQDDWQLERFICSQTIMMSMQGVPAFYIHSLLGTQNFNKGVEETGMNRTINRRKWDATEINGLLNGDTHHSKVLKQLKSLISIRKKQKAFHPNADQKILDLGDKIFAISRDGDNLLCISNITQQPFQIAVSSFSNGNSLYDLISGRHIEHDLDLTSYQTVWLV